MLERRARRGRKVQALEDRPDVYDDLLPVWRGFCTLHAARSCSFGVEPLHMQDILGWLDLYDVTGDERVERFELIRILDGVWLDHVREEDKEKTDANPSPRNRRSRSR